MKKTKVIILILLIAAFAACMFLINRDLYHYEYTYPFSRIFTPEENEKGNYPVTDAVPLKKAGYELSFSASVSGAGCGVYLTDGRDQVIFSADIPSGNDKRTFHVDIAETVPVRVGFSYDPDSGLMEIGQIRLQSSHVLYRESILRHALFSFAATLLFCYIGFRLLRPEAAAAIREKTGIDLPYCERVFLILLALTVLAFWPFFDLSRFTEGDDFYFHLSRIEGMALSLKAGYFPPRILLGWMGNYGIGSGFYYPDLLLFFPVGLCLIGVPTVMALRVFLFFCTFFSLLAIYLAAKNISKGSPVCGTIAAALYAFAAYRLICLFYRNAIGEVQAFIFYPLIVWGLVEILRENVGKWKVFALGFWGLLMSHMISLAISGVLCAVVLLIEIRRLIRDKRIIIALIKATVLTLLLGAFFLLPMAEQSMKNELEINAVMNRPIDIIAYNLTEFSSLFRPFDPWEITDGTMIYPYPGYALLLIPIVRLIMLIKKRTDPNMKIADRLMVAGMIVLAVSTDFFPWPAFNWFLAKIQFSWRFLGPGSMLLCIAGGIYFEMIRSWTTHKKAALAAALCIAVISGMPVLIYTFNHKLYPLDRLILSNKIISGAEYLPPDFNIDYIDSNKNNIRADESLTAISNPRRQKLGFVFQFERIEGDEEAYYSLPLIYYYGYRASMTDAEGTVRPIPVGKDDMGLVRVSDEGLRSGLIRVSYEKTTVQKVSEAISLLTVCGVIIGLSYRKRSLRGTPEGQN